MQKKMRKLLALPFKVLSFASLALFIIITIIKVLIEGRSLDWISDQLGVLQEGFEIASGEESAIIERIEKKYGTGKATQVACILQQEDEE